MGRVGCAAGARAARRLEPPEQQAVLGSVHMWRFALSLGLAWHADAAAGGGNPGEGACAAAALERAVLGHLDDILAAASALPDGAAAAKTSQVPALFYCCLCV